MLELREIARLATPVVGSVAGVERVQGFVGNECFRLRAGGETFYLKSGKAKAIRAEAWACEQAQQVGVLAPTVLAVELQAPRLQAPGLQASELRAPAGYLIERAVPGQPISDADEDILISVGEQLRKVHSIEGDGYGFLHEEPHKTWAEVVRRPFERISELTAAGIVSEQLAARLDALDTFEDEQVDPVLLHADLHPRHIYAAQGKLTGIIDWGDAAQGDPLFDLGRFSRAGATATTALLKGYDLKPTAELESKLTFYRITWSLLALHWELAAGGDWFQAHVDAIEEDLPLLEATN